MRTRLDAWATLSWLDKPGNAAVLADLAAGRLALTHQALAARADRKRAVYVQDLLLASGVLAPADGQLTGYEGWLDRRLASLDGHPRQRLLREFALWHQLPRMRATAAARPLRQTASTYARPGSGQPRSSSTGSPPEAPGPPTSPKPTSTPSTPAARSTRSRPSDPSSPGRSRQGTSPADVPVLRFARGPGIT